MWSVWATQPIMRWPLIWMWIFCRFQKVFILSPHACIAQPNSLIENSFTNAPPFSWSHLGVTALDHLLAAGWGLILRATWHGVWTLARALGAALPDATGTIYPGKQLGLHWGCTSRCDLGFSFWPRGDQCVDRKRVEMGPKSLWS